MNRKVAILLGIGVFVFGILPFATTAIGLSSGDRMEEFVPPLDDIPLPNETAARSDESQTGESRPEEPILSRESELRSEDDQLSENRVDVAVEEKTQPAGERSSEDVRPALVEPGNGDAPRIDDGQGSGESVEHELARLAAAEQRLLNTTETTTAAVSAETTGSEQLSVASTEPAHVVEAVKQQQPAAVDSSAKLQQLSSENTTLREQIETLLQQVIDYRRENKALQAKVVRFGYDQSDHERTLAKELEDARNNFLTANQELNQLRQSVREMPRIRRERDLLEKEVGRLKGSVETVRVETQLREQLQSDKDAAERKLEALEQKIKNADEQLRSSAVLKASLDQSLADLGEARLRQRELEQKLAGTVARLNEAQRGIKDVEQRYAAENMQLKSGVDKALNRIAVLGSEKAEVEGKATKLQTVVDSLTTSKKEIDSKLAAREETVKQTDFELQETKRQLGKALEEIRLREANVSELSTRVARLEVSEKDAVACRATLRSTANELARKSGAEEELAKIKTDWVKLQNRALQCKAELNEVAKKPGADSIPTTVATPAARMPQQQPELRSHAESEVIRMAPALGEKGIVTVMANQPKVALRAGPSLENSAVMEVQKGTQLVVEGRQGDWFQVISPTGRTAYVRADVVTVVDNGSGARAGAVAVPAPIAQPTSPSVKSELSPTEELVGTAPAKASGGRIDDNIAYERLKGFLAGQSGAAGR